MKKFLDRNDPFFAKPWRKWACIVLPVAWGIFELTALSSGWGFVFVCLGSYAAWELVWRAPRDNE